MEAKKIAASILLQLLGIVFIYHISKPLFFVVVFCCVLNATYVKFFVK